MKTKESIVSKNSILFEETNVLHELLNKHSNGYLSDGVLYVLGTPENMQLTYLIGATLPYAGQRWHTATFAKTGGELTWSFQHKGAVIPADTFFDAIKEITSGCPIPADRGWKCVSSNYDIISNDQKMLYTAPCSVVSGINAFLKEHGHPEITPAEGNRWLSKMVDGGNQVNTWREVKDIPSAYYSEQFDTSFSRDFDEDEANDWRADGDEDEDEDGEDANVSHFKSCMSGFPEDLFDIYDHIHGLGNL